jgi:acyl transferase domain-containing protein/NAD(P)-dependent dehydrogenase (short-subunit alcohol dehydrogenase family)/acyl carrier protein/SAM-dependent methyltransferase
MLNLINRYCHGYVSLPVLATLSRHGVFDRIASQAISTEALAKILQARPGHLRIALRLACALGLVVEQQGIWALEDSDSRFWDGADVVLLPLYQIGSDILSDSSQSTLIQALRFVNQTAPQYDDVTRDLLDGSVVLSLLLPLKLQGSASSLTFPEAIRLCCNELQEELEKWTRSRGWFRKDTSLTQAGEMLWERLLNCGVIASYRPLLLQIEKVIFGDPKTVFSRTMEGHESHLDRTLNVVGSGFQHTRYFREVKDLIIPLFDTPILDSQPKYIADMGCGDGSFLRYLYQTIRDKTRRGSLLEQYPLTLLAVDFNQAALDASRKTLEGLPAQFLHGDIGDPASLIETFAVNGISHYQDILHVRSFLDHDRPFLPIECAEEMVRRDVLDLDGAYVTPEGDIRPAELVLQNMVEHLRRWHSVLGPHGMIMLEVHSLRPTVIRTWLDSCENLSFDATQSFSGQLLMEAHEVLAASAEAGLFPRPETSKSFPRTLPYTRITLNHVDARPYRIRNACIEDVSDLLVLEEAWPLHLQRSREAIARRLTLPGNRVFVVEYEGHVVAALYTQRISSREVLANVQYDDLDRITDGAGKILQLIGLSAGRSQQHHGFGNILRNFVLAWARLHPEIESVVGVTRCGRFSGATRGDLESYLAERDEAGIVLDPIVRFHHLHGAEIQGLIPDYRPTDTENLGCGVLISYSLEKQFVTSHEDQNTGDGRDVSALVRSFLKTEWIAHFNEHIPLRDLGYDSLDLLELRLAVEKSYQVALDDTFFFRATTASQIREALIELQDSATDQRSVPSTEQSRRGRPRQQKRETSYAKESLAVVGMACRFPEAPTLEAFWDLLCEERSAIVTLPDERRSLWEETLRDVPTDIAQTVVCGGFLSQVDRFDHNFFRISPREARSLDPQQRLLLETVWHALESSGCNPLILSETQTGTYVGSYTSDYRTIYQLHKQDDDAVTYYATGTDSSLIAGRIAYSLGLRGPALTINTACSSSLTALEIACSHLRSGSIDVALVGATNLMLTPELSVTFAKAGMLSPDGECRTFDASANGYVRAEGIAAVVVKRLSDAYAAGDTIYGIIRGIAVNQDGASNGITAPHVDAQEQLLRACLHDADLSSHDITYLETHGTGTFLGDPIEVEAITRVYGERDSSEQPLLLSSVKTTIGHTEAAAGIAGLIKAILTLRHRYLPGLCHFKTQNPALRLPEGKIEVAAHSFQWDRSVQHKPLRVGVSSFGFSGTNAHVIIEESISHERRVTDELPKNEMLLVSAKSPEALGSLTKEYVKLLRDLPDDTGVSDVCYTSQRGRALLPYRKVVEGGSAGELIEALQNSRATHVSAARTPVYLFTGQGSQYTGMGRGLYKYEPVFREALDRCARDLRHELPVDLLEVLFGTQEATKKLINDTRYTQPTLFALQYGLVCLWEDYGLKPVAVLGHSIGEFAAAYQAGVFSFEDVIRLVAARGRFMQELPAGGAMVAVESDEQTVRQEIALCKGVAIAAVNGPKSVVVSGSADEIALLLQSWRSRFVRVHELTVSHAFHSPLMKPMLEAFAEVAATITYKAPTIPYYSSVLGREVSTEVSNADYWIQQIHQPVLFYPALQKLAAQQAHQMMLELGPRPLLSTLGERAECAGQLQSQGDRVWISTLGGKLDDMQSVQHAVALLVQHGVEIDWEVYTTRRRGSLADLPRYSFDHGMSHWLSVPKTSHSTPCNQYEVVWRSVDSARSEKLPKNWLLIGEDKRLLEETGVLFRDAGLSCQQVLLSDIKDVYPRDVDAVVLILNTQEESSTDLLQWTTSLVEAVQIILKREGLTGLPLWGIIRETLENLPFVTGCESFWRVLHTEYPQHTAPLIRLQSGSTFTSERLQQACGFTSVRFSSLGVSTSQLVRVPAEQGADKALSLRDDVYYLVTGATGGLGQALVERLVECGARRLVLCSRTGVSLDMRTHLEQRGVTIIRDEKVDIAESAAVHALISTLREEGIFLDGVFHAAGQVADSFISQITPDDVNRTLKAKVYGALSLDEATRDLPLSYFVCISSTAALFGTAGQGIYAAANGMLDALCLSRAEHGLPALSFQLGHLNGPTGMASRLRDEVKQDIVDQGIRFLEPAEALDLLIKALVKRRTVICAAAVAWDRYQNAHRHTIIPSVIRDLVSHHAVHKSEPLRQDSRLTDLAHLPQNQRREALSRVLQDLVQTLLGGPDLPEQKTGFFDLGFDSHLTLRFRDELKRVTGVNVPPTLLFEYPTIEQLALALDQWLWKKESAPEIALRSHHPEEHTGAVAIVGMGCRLPGEIRSLAQLLSFLQDGQCAVGEIPAERWEEALKDKAGLVTTTRGAFLNEVFEFDAPFFGISPREALHLDPQQRLLLEVAWETLEDAGMAADSLPRTRTGVFVGIGQHDYARRGLYNGDLEDISAYDGTGALGCFASGRLAHLLGLEGPVLAVDTACSSSLVALHLAIQSLRKGEIDVALAGGVHLVLAPEVTLFLSRIGALSPSGRCQAFDKAADGYGRGEGCGVVALMRLDDARASGRRIHSVILGSAVNHDGASSGLTVPNPQAQKRLYQAALHDAGISSHAVVFVEAHGTGTALGDPIEARSLAEVYGTPDRVAPLAIGSLKSNIGHLEAAAGVAGLLKVAGALKERKIPGHLYGECAPLIKEQVLPVVLPRTWEYYAGDQEILYAGVSSFGMSGTNAHVILAEPPPSISESYDLDRPENSVLLLSAASARSLSLLAQEYGEFLDRCSINSLSWPLVCAAAAHQRVHHRERLAVIARSCEEAAQLLAAYVRGEDTKNVFAGRAVSDGWQIEFGKDSIDLSDLVPHLTASEEPRLGISVWQGIAELYARGATFTWSELWPTPPVINLPLYRFDRKRYALPLKRSGGHMAQRQSVRMLDRRVEIPSLATTIHETSVSQERFPYLADHTIYGSIVVPGAFYLAALVAALESVREGRAVVCTDVVFMKALTLQPEEARMLQLHFKREDESHLSCVFLSFVSDNSSEWVEHGKAKVSFEAITPEFLERSSDEKDATLLDGVQFYRTMAERGIALGPSFRWLQSAAVASTATEATLVPPSQVVLVDQPLFPSLIDACFQAMLCTMPLSQGVFVPLSIEKFIYYAPHQAGCLNLSLNHQEGARAHAGFITADLKIHTEGGSKLFEMYGVTCAHAAAQQLSRHSSYARGASYLYETAWEPIVLPELTKRGAHILYLKANEQDDKIVAEVLRGGAQVTEIVAGIPESTQRGSRSMDPTQISQWTEIFERSEFIFDGIVLGTPAKDDNDDLVAEATRQATIAGALFNALVSSPAHFSPRLWCLAVAEEDGGGPVLDNPAAEIWRGMSRVAAHEQPQRRMSCLVYKTKEDLPLQEIAQVLLSDLEETEIFVKGSEVAAPRLVESTPPRSPVTLDPNETVLVTGGFGTLGRGVIEELISLGSAYFVIVSRRVPGDEETRYLNELHERGIHVRVCRSDIGDGDQAVACMRDALHGFPPLTGIVHAAGVVKDAMLHSISAEQIQHVFGPKVAGLLSLHALTIEFPVRFFISFGSSAAVVGSLGQGIYAAANAFLEGFTNYRRLSGLSATTLHWGPWDRGMTSKLTSRDHERYQEYGLGIIPGEEGFALFSRLLSVGGTRCIQPFLIDQLSTSCAGRPVPSLLKALVSPVPSTSHVAQTKPLVLQTLPGTKRRQLILEITVDSVKEVLRLDDESTLDSDRGFTQLGMDSLMALELRDLLQQRCGVSLPTTVAFQYPTIQDIAQHIEGYFGYFPQGQGLAEKIERIKEEPADEALDTLSEDELTELLRQELTESEGGL